MDRGNKPDKQSDTQIARQRNINKHTAPNQKALRQRQADRGMQTATDKQPDTINYRQAGNDKQTDKQNATNREADGMTYPSGGRQTQKFAPGQKQSY